MLKLETERLQFRQWHESDFEKVAKFFIDGDNVKYVGGLKNGEESWRLIATYIGHYQLKGYSYPAVVEKSTGELIGTVGLWNSELWPEMELGYWIFNEMQGKGYATEAGIAVKNYAFDVLKTSSLVSYIDPENQASVSVAERLGAQEDGKMELLDFGLHMVYRY